MEGQSWPLKALASEPGEVFSLQGPATEDAMPGLEGCESLPFNPSIGIQSTEHHASTPTGLNVDVQLPQQATLEEGKLAEADVRDTTVTLAPGIQLNPSAANGLEACSEQQVGYEGPAGVDPLSAGAPQPLRFSAAPAQCPPASKIGVVQIKTPLLSEELEGSVYLAAQNANPFGSLLALYLVAENGNRGIRVKLAGESQLNQTSGQITTVFANTPQLPFEELKLELSGGPRGPVSTPALCGAYGSEAMFTPWSVAPGTGNGAVQGDTEPGELQVSSGAGASPCADPQPFAPIFQAGAESTQAGAFTSFALNLERPDGQQALSAVTLRLPPGVAALLSTVTPCPEPQASRGECGTESEIGQASASAGLGPDPITQTGRAYITGPYQGAPFGLSIVTPAVAGPFNLGNIVVRSAIDVDPHTAAVTISSSLPTIVQGVGMAPSGIPLQLKQIHVSIDRPGFEFNPTNCSPMAITGTLSGSEGASAGVSSPFQVANCQSLLFKPTVAASTEGKTSKLDGASLRLKFASATGQAHVAKTVLTIPAILPARLTTIQKACLAATFETNPAACPEGSDIGTAIVHTPVLKSPLTGPIYLVSHGNAAWPDAELVLQGEDITIILDGQTAIKKGVTTSSFLSVPDAPFESVEATLPEGPYSALTTNLPLKDHYSLCGQNLTIPTALTGQNGTSLTDAVKVTVQGCGAVRANRTKRLTRAQKLTLALKACHQHYRRSRAKRSACERQAQKRYSPESKSSMRRAHKT